MTDPQILEALVGKAQKNGWKVAPLLSWGPEMLPYERYIFDPEFIQALCKNKIQIPVNFLEFTRDGELALLYFWQYTLIRLAIAPNRLEYLQQEFLEQPNKEN